MSEMQEYGEREVNLFEWTETFSCIRLYWIWILNNDCIQPFHLPTNRILSNCEFLIFLFLIGLWHLVDGYN